MRVRHKLPLMSMVAIRAMPATRSRTRSKNQPERRLEVGRDCANFRNRIASRGRLTAAAGGPEVWTERGTERQQARIARKDDRQDSPSLLQLRLGQLLHPGREVPEPDRRAGRGRESRRAGWSG